MWAKCGQVKKGLNCPHDVLQHKAQSCLWTMWIIINLYKYKFIYIYVKDCVVLTASDLKGIVHIVHMTHTFSPRAKNCPLFVDNVDNLEIDCPHCPHDPHAHQQTSS